MDVKMTLYNLLNSICEGNVFLQGTLNPEDPYPHDFITYFTTTTADNAHFDNEVTSYEWTFYVIYYSDDPQKVATVPLQIASILKQAGFIPQGRGNDVVSDEKSHTGWAMDFLFVEYLK